MNAPLPAGAVAVATLPIDAIVASPSNPRKHFDETYIAELAESIKAHGLIQPITVRPLPLDAHFEYNKRRKTNDDSHPQYEIVVGECRWRAAKLAGLDDIPAFWRELDDKSVLETQIIENLNRRDVHPIEEAEGYEQLMKLHGYKAEEIAAKIGKSRGYVYARLKLTALCPPAREAFFAGHLDASTALLIARIPGEPLQKKAVKEITYGYNGEPLSYRSAKTHIRCSFTISLKQATFPPDDAALAPAAGSCTECPKRSGNAPEICADLDDEDVCTDTQCFDDKRLTRRQKLLDNAEKKGIAIFTGDSGWDAYRDEKRVDPDEVVKGDGQERTYREILGDKLPRVEALVEVGHGKHQRLIEMADATAMEKALKKAGWQRDIFKEDGDGANSKEAPQRDEAWEAEQAAKEAHRQAADAEEKRRAELKATIWPHLQAVEASALPNVLRTLAAAWTRMQADEYEFDTNLFEQYGYTTPEEFNDAEEAEKAIEAMQSWPIGKVLALLFDYVLFEEMRVYPHQWKPGDTSKSLSSLTEILGFSPSPAAQAPDKDAEPAAPAKPKGKKAAGASA